MQNFSMCQYKITTLVLNISFDHDKKREKEKVQHV